MDQNTSTADSVEPIVKTGSSSEPVNFDDMEALMAQKPAKRSPVDEELGVEKPKAKPEQKKPEAKKAKAEEAEEAEAPEAEGKGKEKLDSTKVKAFKAKAGDAEMEIPANAKIPVKINGKLEEVDVQTLVNEFSGKTDWSRKYQELDTEKKTFEAERVELQSSVDDLFELAVTQNKPLEAVAYLADLLGGDGMKTIADLQQQMYQKFEELSKLTPEEKRARQAEEKAQLVEAKYKNQDAKRTKASEQEEVAKRVEAVKKQYNITEERFGDIYRTLKKNGVNDQELTPEFVGEVHQRWLQMDQVDEIVAEQAYTDNALQVKQALLDEWRKEPSLTREDMAAIAEQVFGSGKSGSKLKQKIQRNGGTTTTAKKPIAQAVQEAVTFDDLE